MKLQVQGMTCASPSASFTARVMAATQWPQLMSSTWKVIIVKLLGGG
jgi:hypothetical protein